MSGPTALAPSHAMPRTAAEVVAIGRATVTDAPQLQALQASCPERAALSVAVVSAPDFFARVKSYDSFTMYVARTAAAGGRVVGATACALRDGVVGGRPCRLGYGFQTLVAPDAEPELARKLLERADRFLRVCGASLLYRIVHDRDAAGRRHALTAGLTPERRLTLATLPVHRALPERPGAPRVRPFTPADAEAVAALANRTFAGHEMYEPLSADRLLAFVERTPGYRAGAVFVVEERGAVRACAAVRDLGLLERTTVSALAPSLWARAAAWGALGLVRAAPRMPRPGQALRRHVLHPLGWDDPALLGDLVRAHVNRAHAAGVDQLLVAAEKGHPLLGALAGLPRVSTGMRLYVAPTGRDNTALGAGPLYVSPVDL